MPIKYKINVLSALKDAGYNTTRLRKEKVLAEGVIQSLRVGAPISFQNLGKICALLSLQPGDILVMEQDGQTIPKSPDIEQSQTEDDEDLKLPWQE